MPDSTLLLVVEDESILLMDLKAALEAGGYSVMAAANGNGALAALEGEVERISGLITDVRLGDGPDGWSIADRARELNPHLPVVYTTAESADTWRINGVPESRLVRKPYASAQVLTAISELVTDAKAED